MTVEFPRLLLREKSHSWNLVGAAATPGQDANSVSPIIRSDGGGYWSCVMSSVSLSGIRGSSLIGRNRQKAATLLWRAVQTICDGGVNSIVVPRNDALFIPLPAGASRSVSIPHSDGSFFGDGSGYYQPVIDVTCNAGADLRDTSMSLNLHHCGALQGGEAFSIQHPTFDWRIYQIGTVEMVTDTIATVTFSPPLREDVTDGDRIELDRPRCTMRLKNPSSMDLSVEPWTFNTASVEFVEADVDTE